MADEDVTIELPLDDPAPSDKLVDTIDKKVEVAAEATPDPPLTRTKKDPDDGIASMKAQYEERLRAEKQARDASDAEASRRRQEAEQARAEVTKARNDVAESHANVIENAIAAAEAEASHAQRDWQLAQEGGDYAKASEFQRKMARAEAKLVRLEEARSDLADAATKRTQEPKPAAQQNADPFEAALANTSPRTQTWLRANPQFVTDPKMNMKANAAHNMALAEGFVPDSDAYFDYCEKFLGLKSDPVDPPKPRTRTAMPAAPVSRDSSNPTNGNLSKGQVMLTPGEQRNATDGTITWTYDDKNGKFKKGDPIGMKEMAVRKSQMEAEGRYSNVYTNQ